MARRPRTSLSGRSVLITGAARGIGAELARRAAARGARVALVGLDTARAAVELERLAPPSDAPRAAAERAATVAIEPAHAGDAISAALDAP